MEIVIFMLQRNNYLLSLRLACIFVWCTACGGSDKNTDTRVAIDPDSIEYRTVSNTDKAFSIDVPLNLLGAPKPASTDAIEVLDAFYEIPEDSTDSFKENILLVTGDLTQEDVLPSAFSNHKITSSSNELVGSYNAEIVTGKFDLTSERGDSINLEYMTITIETHGKLYGLQYMAEARRFNTYKEIAKKMVASWQIGLVIEGTGDTTFQVHDYPPASITNNNDGYLVTYCMMTSLHSSAILSKLISKDGEILKEIVIDGDISNSSTVDCASISPKVIFNGSNYLVAYSIRDSLENNSNTELFAKRISTDGNVLDDTPILISNYKNHLNQSSFDITFDGGNSVVVWYDEVPDDSRGQIRKILASFISNDGSISTPITVHEFSESYSNPVSPMVKSNQNSILIAWEGRRDFEAIEISFDGNIISLELINPLPDSSEYQSEVTFTSTDSEFIFSWNESGSIHAVRVSNGQLIYPNLPEGTEIVKRLNSDILTLINSNYFDGVVQFLYEYQDSIYSITTDTIFSGMADPKQFYPCCSKYGVNKSHIDGDNYLVIVTLRNGKVIAWP